MAARYVDLNGVHTWYDQRGAGEPVVLLHGALIDSRCFDGNLATLADRFALYLPERRGHGHTADPGGPISAHLMAEDTVAFLDAVTGPVRLVGYSAGAVVALLVALARPDLVERLVLISGAYHRDGWLLPPARPADIPRVIYDAHGEVSPDGAEHLAVVVDKIAATADELALTEAELKAVRCRALVLVGDDDAVSPQHTLSLYHALPQAQLAVLPNASHTLLLEQPDLCTRLVADFLTGEPAPTLMPVRRG
ncbi:alpha/beta fold hydrolase [Catellatospora tritici]|uniref:alpha/beta fold hydrolase n=1 Tax=Catellatospora tritici TaxID=2851566 RepID=UPI001C2D9E97|nr:alpha/beta hydrolase [Catellatospora tritici]MBV1849418.1 alpha/beta hydrolase [Catellatospora tritici]